MLSFCVILLSISSHLISFVFLFLAAFWVVADDVNNAFSNPVSAELATTRGCIASGTSPPTPQPTTGQPTIAPPPPAPTSQPPTRKPTNKPTSNPTSQPTTGNPTTSVATIAKYICQKAEPLPATICTNGRSAGGKCATEGSKNSCGSAGRVCWWNPACPA